MRISDSMAASRLMMDMQRMSQEAGVIDPNLGMQNPLQAQKNTAEDQSFFKVLSYAIDKVHDLQQDSGNKNTAFQQGDPNVSLVEVMIAGQKASLGFEALRQFRNKFVEAYQLISRMPV